MRSFRGKFFLRLPLDVVLSCCDGVKIKTNKCFYASFDQILGCVFKSDNIVPDVIILPEFTSQEVHSKLLNHFSDFDSITINSQCSLSSPEEDHDEERSDSSPHIDSNFIGKTFECPSGDQLFKKRAFLSKCCFYCGAQFETPKKLARHYYNVHPKVTDTFKCEVCLERFPYKHVLTKHVERKHRNLLFPCLSCNKSFTLKFNLLRHVRKFHPLSEK